MLFEATLSIYKLWYTPFQHCRTQPLDAKFIPTGAVSNDYSVIRLDINGSQVVQATQACTPKSMVNPVNTLSIGGGLCLHGHQHPLLQARLKDFY